MATSPKDLLFCAAISLTFSLQLTEVCCAEEPVPPAGQHANSLTSAGNSSSPAGKLKANKRKNTAPTKPNDQLSMQSQRSLELNEQGAAALSGKDFSRAETLFKQALSADPMNLTAAYNLAGVYISNKNEEEAISLLTSYSAKYPEDAGIIVRLGDAHFGNQDVSKSIIEYRKAFAMDPTFPGLASKLGTLLSLKGDIKEAASMYEAALKSTPKDVQVLGNLSSLYLALQRPKEAVATAKLALQLTPSRDLYITMGNAYLDLKDNSNALHAFERAAASGATNVELSRQIDDLRASIKSTL